MTTRASLPIAAPRLTRLETSAALRMTGRASTALGEAGALERSGAREAEMKYLVKNRLTRQ
jgi:hypothetical protein